MKLYRKIYDANGKQVREREAKPAEYREAARPHADLEAAERLVRVFIANDQPWDVKEGVQAIVDAALGADDE